MKGEEEKLRRNGIEREKVKEIKIAKKERDQDSKREKQWKN